jgi:aminopeptidase N
MKYPCRSIAKMVLTIALLLAAMCILWRVVLYFTTRPQETTTFAPTHCQTPSHTVPAAPATAAPAASNIPAGEIGAPGLGDPYFPRMGNGGYDVQHYDLRLTVDLEKKTIAGEAVITARATQDLGRFNLDFTGLQVDSVKVDGAEAGFALALNELEITPVKTIPNGAGFTVDIAYHGTPVGALNEGYLDGWSFYPEGVIVAGEPDGAETWFPVNNHPSDKATYSFAITVDGDYQVAANGVLRGAVSNGDGTTTYTWAMDDPMASYLATVAIGKFDLIEDTSPAGIPVRSYITPDFREDVEPVIRRIPEILDFYQSVFGPYPFDAGGVVVHDLPLMFALENQTLVVMGAFFNESVVAHELAHMWFGDSVSVAEWSEIWLNEGFASYAEVLWIEHSQGRAEADKDVAHRYQVIAGWTNDIIPIGDPGADMIFSLQVYDRGALTLHALRLLVGDEPFFRILRTYADRYEGGIACTEDFTVLAEEISGMDLDAFFDDWLVQPDLPDMPELGLKAKDFRD